MYFSIVLHFDQVITSYIFGTIILGDRQKLFRTHWNIPFSHLSRILHTSTSSANLKSVKMSSKIQAKIGPKSVNSSQIFVKSLHWDRILLEFSSSLTKIDRQSGRVKIRLYCFIFKDHVIKNFIFDVIFYLVGLLLFL